jgi:hypothetical protein
MFLKFHREQGASTYCGTVSLHEAFLVSGSVLIKPLHDINKISEFKILIRHEED